MFYEQLVLDGVIVLFYEQLVLDGVVLLLYEQLVLDGVILLSKFAILSYLKTIRQANTAKKKI